MPSTGALESAPPGSQPPQRQLASLGAIESTLWMALLIRDRCLHMIHTGARRPTKTYRTIAHTLHGCPRTRSSANTQLIATMTLSLRRRIATEVARKLLPLTTCKSSRFRYTWASYLFDNPLLSCKGVFRTMPCSRFAAATKSRVGSAAAAVKFGKLARLTVLEAKLLSAACAAIWAGMRLIVTVGIRKFSLFVE